MVLMGNAVWTTTHSASHLGVYDKFLSRTVNIDIDFLTTPGNIKAIAYQALMPNLCDCSLPLSVLSDPKFPEYQPSAGLFSGLISELYDLNLDSVKVRNPYGCPKCKHPSVPRLNGLIGRTLAAEVIEPDDILLGLLKKRDHVGMADYVRSLRGEERFDSIVMNGKSAMECAVYKMSLGQIDPRDVEVRFHSFEKESMIRKILAKRKASL